MLHFHSGFQASKVFSFAVMSISEKNCVTLHKRKNTSLNALNKFEWLCLLHICAHMHTTESINSFKFFVYRKVVEMLVVDTSILRTRMRIEYVSRL